MATKAQAKTPAKPIAKGKKPGAAPAKKAAAKK
jgi:hypothetical protein